MEMERQMERKERAMLIFHVRKAARKVFSGKCQLAIAKCHARGSSKPASFTNTLWSINHYCFLLSHPWQQLRTYLASCPLYD